MTETQTPVMEKAASAVPSAPVEPPKKAPEKKKKKKKVVKNIVITLVILAVLAGAAFAIWFFVFREPTAEKGEALNDTAMIGSISNVVKGYGSASAKDSATITLAAAGIVQDVFVTEGQVVQQGDPLYVITSAAAEQALATAKESYQKQVESMNDLQKQLSELYESRADLTIKVPHAGKLTECASLNVGDQVSAGTKIAVVVDDTRLKLSLYYSYAYENDIYVGQTADISIPATMSTLTGKVETINKVERIVPEGGKTFEVIFIIDNPGTMTAGMAASAALKDGAGSDIFPYESGSFEYNRTTTITAKSDGPAEQISGLLNYGAVTAGKTLIVQGTKTVDEKIAAKQDQITEAQKTLDEAAKKVTEEQKNLDNFSAVAPITGTVITCALSPGQEVASGLAAVTIADNTVMTVNINVDERNIQYIKQGMTINFTSYAGSYMGVVESVAQVGKNENGITTYPTVVKVDNPDGSLMGGMGLDYEFTAASSTDVVVIPLQDVHYASLGGSEPTALVYLLTDTAPENAVDVTTLPEDMQKLVPKGYYVVPVVTGLADEMNVEIKEGLKEGDQVFNNWTTNSADSWQNGGGGGVMIG